MKMTLKALRINAGLKQTEAAEKIGIYIDTLRNYETGKTSPSQRIIERICDVYGTDYDSIKFLSND